ncbi:MAG: hypothetical protein JXA97_04925 [Anaerolineales bacterium]|nr:hypothetical protein [Anaerolineales bacterium]
MSATGILMVLSIGMGMLMPASGAASVREYHDDWHQLDRRERMLQEGAGRIEGRVRQGTAGADVPAGLEVGMVGIEAAAVVVEQFATIDSDGYFVFTGVEAVPDRIYGVFAAYEGIDYFSSGIELDAENLQAQVELVIYEAGASEDEVVAEQVHFLVDINDNQQFEITQVWLLTTGGDRAYVPGGEGMFEIGLPEHFFSLDIEPPLEGEVFDNGTSLAVRAPIRPEQTTDVVFRTTLVAGEEVFRVVTLSPIGSAIWLVPLERLTISAPGLMEVGTVDLAGTTLRRYEQDEVPAGAELAINITHLSETSDGILILAISGAIILLCGGILWNWNRRRLGTRDEVYELLTRTLAELDQAYQDGKIEEERYLQRRALLKEQALARMPEGHD